MNFKKVIFSFFIFLANALFVSFSYNYQVLFEYLGFEVEQTYIGAFTLTTIFHFVLAQWILRSYSTSVKTFILCITASFCIDASTYITGDNLIPLRSPFAMIFPIMGTGLAFLYKEKKIGYFIVSTGVTISFLLLSWKLLIPKLMYIMYEKNKIINVNRISILSNNKKVVTISGNEILLQDTLKHKTAIIEWYFVGCNACEMKLKILQRIADTFNHEPFKIALLCESSINSYDQFKLDALKKTHPNIDFFYDINHISFNYIEGGFQSFPVTLIFDSKGIFTNVYQGVYPNEITEKCIREEITDLKKIMNL